MAIADTSPAHVLTELHRGMRLFHDGMRDASVAPLLGVLQSRHGTSPWRLAAAGLLAETARGNASFERAEHFYRIALAEADSLPPAERAANEWYQHYRPRCALGLVTVLRRLLSPDHRRISAELRDTRDLAQIVVIDDLPGQLDAVEGVYRRQLGDLHGAIELLSSAREQLAGVEGHCFWWPEHAEAMLIQAQLLMASGRPLVHGRASRMLANPLIRSWSRAVAASCLLHLQLQDLVERESTAAQFFDALHDRSAGGAGRLFEVLERSADQEGDPLLLSEGLVLRLAWRRAAGVDDPAGEGRLLELVEDTPPILGVLRGCELGWLRARFPLSYGPTSLSSSALMRRASDLLEVVRPSLPSYGSDASTISSWAALLEPPSARASAAARSWLDGPLSPLRCLAWP